MATVAESPQAAGLTQARVPLIGETSPAGKASLPGGSETLRSTGRTGGGSSHDSSSLEEDRSALIVSDALSLSGV